MFRGEKDGCKNQPGRLSASWREMREPSLKLDAIRVEVAHLHPTADQGDDAFRHGRSQPEVAAGREGSGGGENFKEVG